MTPQTSRTRQNTKIRVALGRRNYFMQQARSAGENMKWRRAPSKKKILTLKIQSIFDIQIEGKHANRTFISSPILFNSPSNIITSKHLVHFHPGRTLNPLSPQGLHRNGPPIAPISSSRFRNRPLSSYPFFASLDSGSCRCMNPSSNSIARPKQAEPP